MSDELRSAALRLGVSHAEWVLKQRVTDSESPYFGWLGSPVADTPGRPAGRGMPASRLGWAVGGLATLGWLLERPDWAEAARGAGEAALRNWGEVNVLDHEGGFILARSARPGRLPLTPAMTRALRLWGEPQTVGSAASLKR